TLAVADELQTHVVVVHLGNFLALEHRQEQGHETLDLLVRAQPVFTAEGEQGQILDLTFDAGKDDFARGLSASPMSRRPRTTIDTRPAVIAVHDDCDVHRQGTLLYRSKTGCCF